MLDPAVAIKSLSGCAGGVRHGLGELEKPLTRERPLQVVLRKA
jgi:hypothetical protein